MKQDTEQLRQLAYDYLKDGRLSMRGGIPMTVLP